MRRRRGTGSGANFPALDSFMDIITNVLGSMFFIVAYAALSSSGTRGLMRTPVASTPDTEGVIFECRRNTVFLSEADELIERAHQVYRDAEKAGVTDWAERLERMRRAKVGNRYYTYEPQEEQTNLGWSVQTQLVDELQPNLAALGEAEAEIRNTRQSQFVKDLRRLDRRRQHVYFLVRDDSFEIFRAARDIAVKESLQVGWEPIAADIPLRFGSGGRARIVY